MQTLPKSHFAIAKVWLDFYRSHLQRFMTGQLDHLSDDFHYSTARVSSDGVTYIPSFLREWPSVLPVLPEHTRELYLANMTSRPAASHSCGRCERNLSDHHHGPHAQTDGKGNDA